MIPNKALRRSTGGEPRAAATHHDLSEVRSHLSIPPLLSWHLFKAHFAKQAIANIFIMAYPASDFWYHLLSSSDALLAAVASGHLELSTIPSPLSNWQLLPFGGVYLIKNEAFGPLYQLGLSLDGHEPSLIAINLSSTEQHWELKPVEGSSVRIQNVALGDVSFLNVTRKLQGCDAVETWKVEPVKLIDASFGKNTQVSLSWTWLKPFQAACLMLILLELSFAPAIRSVPNETSSGDHPLPEAPY